MRAGSGALKAHAGKGPHRPLASARSSDWAQARFRGARHLSQRLWIKAIRRAFRTRSSMKRVRVAVNRRYRARGRRFEVAG
jgi:hypothetical protein